MDKGVHERVSSFSLAWFNMSNFFEWNDTANCSDLCDQMYYTDFPSWLMLAIFQWIFILISSVFQWIYNLEFNITLFKYINPFKYIDMVYAYMFNWLHDFNVGLYLIFKVVFKVIVTLYYMYWSLIPQCQRLFPELRDWLPEFLIDETIEDLEVKQKDKSKTTEEQLEEMTIEHIKSKVGAQSSKSRNKKVARGQKKEKLKAKMRKGSPQPGPSGVHVEFEDFVEFEEEHDSRYGYMVEFEVEHESRCGDLVEFEIEHDSRCACEACLNEVD